MAALFCYVPLLRTQYAYIILIDSWKGGPIMRIQKHVFDTLNSLAGRQIISTEDSMRLAKIYASTGNISAAISSLYAAAYDVDNTEEIRKAAALMRGGKNE